VGTNELYDHQIKGTSRYLTLAAWSMYPLRLLRSSRSSIAVLTTIATIKRTYMDAATLAKNNCNVYLYAIGNGVLFILRISTQIPEVSVVLSSAEGLL
jgi:hypothetical protein